MKEPQRFAEQKLCWKLSRLQQRGTSSYANQSKIINKKYRKIFDTHELPSFTHLSSKTLTAAKKSQLLYYAK